MYCLNCSKFHKSTALTAGENALIVTVTNNSNIADEDVFCFVLCQNPNTVLTSNPVPVQMTVNGANIPVYNKYSKPLNSHTLAKYYRRGVMRGYYVNSNDSAYIIFNKIPHCQCNQ